MHRRLGSSIGKCKGRTSPTNEQEASCTVSCDRIRQKIEDLPTGVNTNASRQSTVGLDVKRQLGKGSMHHGESDVSEAADISGQKRDARGSVGRNGPKLKRTGAN